MRKRIMRGMPVFALILFAFIYGAWAQSNPDRIPWRTDVEAALKDADEKGLPIVINFTSPFGAG